MVFTKVRMVNERSKAKWRQYIVISYSLGMILSGNDSARSSPEPQQHNNQVAQATPINRPALREVRIKSKVRG